MALIDETAIEGSFRTKVPEKLLEMGVKAGLTGAIAKMLADKISADELDYLITLEITGNDDITSNYLSLLKDKYTSSRT